ncbi:MAG: response regulator [Myxococcota bacterium]
MTFSSNKPLVLYVEDDEDTFNLARLRLQARYEVIPAATDREACAVLAEQGRALYAVLMDVELQGSSLDGLALVKLIRGNLSPKPGYAEPVPTLPHLPIIVMTAYVTRYSESDVKALGANHFLTKPIDFTRLNLALAQANIQSVMAQLAAAAPKKK